MKINGIEVTSDFEASLEELQSYVELVSARVQNVASVKVHLCEDGYVDVTYIAHGARFERIRRITGYLVGTTDRWNDAKQAEERDRVKHS